MNRTSFFSFDIIILIATLALIIIGILFIFSSGVAASGVSVSTEYQKQIVWAVTGVILLLLFLFLNYNLVKTFALPIYITTIIILIYTLLFGKDVNGARSWIDLKFVGFQPSEFTKIVTIFFLATYFEKIGKKIQNLLYFLIGLGIIVIPILLILMQPDLGTALVFIPIFIIMSFISGAKIRHILFIMLFGLLIIGFIVAPDIEKILTGERFPVFSILQNGTFILIMSSLFTTVIGLSIWGYLSSKLKFFYWIIYSLSILTSTLVIAYLISLKTGTLLKDYQIMRLIGFINPYLDSRGAGWNIIQSLTAVGSGGFWGKGFLNGTQSHLQYLPQQSTDFIFSIIAEEWGFIGSIFVLVLFLVILYRSIRIISNTKEKYAILIGAGVIGMIYFHLIINIGMAIGIMPITGIPLMLLSYGGSSLWTAMIGIGIILNISFRRFR